MAKTETIFWRRLDTDGLERLTIVASKDRILVDGTILTTEDGGCRVDHHWRLDRDWRVLHVTITRTGTDGDGTLHLQRAGNGWMVNGQPRPDLDGAHEVDLSLTPFCNSVALRRLAKTSCNTIALDVAYVDGTTLDVSRSRQAYDRIDSRRFRFRDLGTASGYEAMLDVDDDGFVTRYEGLFARAN